MKWFIAALVISSIACGPPPRLGVLVNEIGLGKTRIGDAPSDVAVRQFVSPSSLRRATRADVLGDEAAEVIAELDGGRGIEIRDRSGALIREMRTTGYLTDFGAVEASRRNKRDLILYTYPNETKGGTFTVTTADRVEVAKWDERPPPSRFAVSTWKGQPAVFYLQGGSLVVRSSHGQPLARLPAPQGEHFSSLYVAALPAGPMVVLASGDGGTANHMICIYDVAAGRLVFQEIAEEHAFGVAASAEDSAFVVLTRSTEWRYAPGPASNR